MIPQQCSQFELFGIVSSNSSYVNAVSHTRNFAVLKFAVLGGIEGLADDDQVMY